MQIDIIDNRQDFLGLKEGWEAVYAADPEAQFFLSWIWMTKWLDGPISAWVVLAARRGDESSPYEAFLPLRIQVAHTKNGTFFTDISAACNGLADYVGLLCLPGAAADAIPAMAECLQTFKWSSFNLESFHASEERTKHLLAAFPRSRFKIKKETTMGRAAEVDRCVSPYIALPDDWDTYLEKQVSANSRQKIRRFLKKVEMSDDCRITLTNTDTIDRDLDILLGMWRIKWSAHKGPAVVEVFDNICRMMLRHCLEHGTLFMPVLWQGDRPLGVLASLIDSDKKTLLFFVTGRDQTVKSPPSGLVLHGYSIRHAISQGLTTYDFLRGNEPYKYSFGVQERNLLNVSIDRKLGGKKLDQRCLQAVLVLIKNFQKHGEFAMAERGYQQILAMSPDNETARFGLGQVLVAKGDRAQADRVLAKLGAGTKDMSL